MLSVMVYVVMDVGKKILNKVKPLLAFLAIVLLQRELCPLTMMPCWAWGQSLLKHVCLQLEGAFKQPSAVLLVPV